ncbi:MAG: hypothetical protein GKS05_10300 [Nitrospirales bacterium]|nr:hypothetical protein [Nitrospirales bacterium]NKB82256.1 hypothetical protein [Nitrospirales bacterium]
MSRYETGRSHDAEALLLAAMGEIMKRVGWVAVLAAAIWFMGAVSAFAETMYAKKNGVKVTAEKSPTSSVVTTLEIGDQVEVMKKAGRQYYVILSNGKTGWVFKFKISKTKPAGKSGGSGLSGLTGNNRMMAKEARSGGSIRGLKETTNQYAQHKQIDPIHRQSVENMEQLVISNEELARFQQEGGVGEYVGGGQ